MDYKVKQSTEVGQIGETGVHVSVITAMEQEHGTELDLVPTLLHTVMEGKNLLIKTVIISMKRLKTLKCGTISYKPKLVITRNIVFIIN